MSNKEIPIVSIIMGSQSDWDSVEPASKILDEFSIPHECKIVSAHRTPDRHKDFATNAKKRGIKVILAAAGGAAVQQPGFMGMVLIKQGPLTTCQRSVVDPPKSLRLDGTLLL